MINQNVKEFIEHHGVKGMRWGVRRSRGGYPPSKRSKKRTVYEKSPKKLSSSELDRRIKRMEMEKKYNELNKRDVSRGEQLAHEVLTNVGRATVTTVLTGAGLYAIKTGLAKKGLHELATMATKRK